MKKPIGVKVNMPKTEEGKAMLHNAMLGFNAMPLSWGLRAWNATEQEKRTYVNSLNGVAPWAEEMNHA